MRCATGRLRPAAGWIACSMIFASMADGQECAPPPCPGGCLTQPVLVAELELAMSLANRGDFDGAATVAAAAFEQSGDPGAGFALVQLLEQAAAAVPLCSTGRLELQSRASDVARRLMTAGQLPANFASQLPRVVCREAIALAESGCADRSRAVLEEAFQQGYCGFDEVLAQPALRKVLGADQLEQLVSAARQKSAEELIRSSRMELDQFQAFPFALNTIDIDANPLDLSLLDEQVVVVCLWGSWCPACRQNLAVVKSVAVRHEQDVAVIVLAFENGDVESGTEAARQALDGNEPRVRVALGEPGMTKSLPGFEGFPALLFLGPAGTVRLMLSGQVTEQKVAAVLELLLNKTADRVDLAFQSVNPIPDQRAGSVSDGDAVDLRPNDGDAVDLIAITWHPFHSRIPSAATRD